MFTHGRDKASRFLRTIHAFSEPSVLNDFYIYLFSRHFNQGDLQTRATQADSGSCIVLYIYSRFKFIGSKHDFNSIQRCLSVKKMV